VKSHIVFKQNNILGRENEGNKRGHKARWGGGGKHRRNIKKQESSDKIMVEAESQNCL
jgi:hypothetical protein